MPMICCLGTALIRTKKTTIVLSWTLIANTGQPNDQPLHPVTMKPNPKERREGSTPQKASSKHYKKQKRRALCGLMEGVENRLLVSRSRPKVETIMKWKLKNGRLVHVPSSVRRKNGRRPVSTSWPRWWNALVFPKITLFWHRSRLMFVKCGTSWKEYPSPNNRTPLKIIIVHHRRHNHLIPAQQPITSD